MFNASCNPVTSAIACVCANGVLASVKRASLPSATVPEVVPKFLLNAVFLVNAGSTSMSFLNCSIVLVNNVLDVVAGSKTKIGIWDAIDSVAAAFNVILPVVLIGWLKFQPLVAFHIIVLSVVPLSVIPPPLADASLAPWIVNVIEPAVEWFDADPSALKTVNCVALLTTPTLASMPKAPAPKFLAKTWPGIIPLVFPVVKLTMLVPVANVATKFVLEVTDPNSIFLSSTVNSLAFKVVVVPFIVKLPPTISSPPIFNAPAIPTPPLTVNAPVVIDVEAAVLLNVISWPVTDLDCVCPLAVTEAKVSDSWVKYDPDGWAPISAKDHETFALPLKVLPVDPIVNVLAVWSVVADTAVPSVVVKSCPVWAPSKVNLPLDNNRMEVCVIPPQCQEIEGA